MSLPSFQEAMTQFIEPWKTLVEIVNTHFHQKYFSNFVILGQYSADEKVIMNAWSIVGLAPGCHTFLECHLTTGTETEKPHWVQKLREALPALSVIPELAKVDLHFLGGSMHAKLGLDKTHVIGMISLHQTVTTKEDFIVLWKHPHLPRSLVESIMKGVLEKRL